MKRKKLFAIIFSLTVWIMAGTTGVVALGMSYYFSFVQRSEVETDVARLARIVEGAVGRRLADNDVAEARNLCGSLRGSDDFGLILFDRNGEEACDHSSGVDEAVWDIGYERLGPALKGKAYFTILNANSTNGKIAVAAGPIRYDGEIVGAYLVALADKSRSVFYPGITIFMLILSVGAAALLSHHVSVLMTRPLDNMTHGVMRLAIGRHDTRFFEFGSAESAALAGALNQMAETFESKINDVTTQKQRGEAVLSCMKEGVVAVGADMTILRLNPMARQILNIKSSRAEGQPLFDVCGNGEFTRFVNEGIVTGEPGEKEIMMDFPVEKYIQVIRGPLHNETGAYVGLVAAINDVTRLRRLENLRRDFAANVSHELRTPITSIKGFVETLRSGALHNPEKAERFLGIIEKHVDRLNGIIEGLLNLSRIENEDESSSVTLVSTHVLDVIEKALADTAFNATGRGMKLTVDCDPELVAPLNQGLMERAVANLVDNAIRYSDPHSEIWVTATITQGNLSIHVRDEGCGIEKHHLERLFERFYRVDTGRSRKMGGAGLGLSIVKHIALAHGGKVTVNSVPGEGSVFSIHIPVTRTEEEV